MKRARDCHLFRRAGRMVAGPLADGNPHRATEPAPSPSYASASAMPATNPRWSPRWSDAYFAPRNVELSGRLHTSLGVDLFKRMVVTIGHAMGRRADSPNSCFLCDRSERGLLEFEHRTRHSEAVHLLGVAATSFAMGALAISSNGTPARLTLLGLVMAANLYPVLLQRDTRVRIERCLDRAAARKAAN